MQIRMDLNAPPEWNHYWDADAHRWFVTPAGQRRSVLTGKKLTVRYSHDSATWVDRLTGQFHSHALSVFAMAAAAKPENYRPRRNNTNE